MRVVDCSIAGLCHFLKKTTKKRQRETNKKGRKKYIEAETELK
jgi:hypothetical protein